MKSFKLIAAFLALLLLAGCGQKEKLFNGKNLDGWVCVTATPDEHTFAAQGGVLVNEADCEASAGYIGLQSEGGAIDFRNITVE